ncbi:MAG: type II toxin-antitoxin system HicA family toxin [archaeon]
MPSLRSVSGKTCIKILCNRFGFSIARTKGSHVVLRKESLTGSIGTVVPLHSTLKIGTLRGVLELAQISEEDFAGYL